MQNDSPEDAEMPSTPSEFSTLQTEERNPHSADIDTVSTLELCAIINNEDATVAAAVKQCIPAVAAAIDVLAERVRRGGRVIYVGAGTSGRLGVLDASEIPPTFSASPHQYVALIAGGDVALRSAREGAEDSLEGAVRDLETLNIDGARDSLIAIASSGRTPYCLSSLSFAKGRGCVTVGIACTSPSAMRRSGNVDFMIEAVTGPEVVTGSTRMKAGTATKLILNMLSTGVMTRIGKTYGNIMVDVKPTNVKLQYRARRILRDITGVKNSWSDVDLDALLSECDRSVKLAAVVLNLGISVEEARRRLQDADGILANLLKLSRGVSDEILPNDLERSNFVLCVDAGASKCKAVLLNRDGVESTGEAGPCNAVDIGVNQAVSEIEAAIRKAAERYFMDKDAAISSLKLARVCVGVAGGDRESVAVPLRERMAKILGMHPESSLNVTNDLELLATACDQNREAKNIVVLIAGTGSIAMHYRREAGVLKRAARRGGWGALLGDDGSGFDIGRQGIRHALRHLESHQSPPNGLHESNPIDSLPALILNHYKAPYEKLAGYDLLSAVLLPEAGGSGMASETKRRIADCARVVLDNSSTSDLAAEIVDSALQSLVGLVRSLFASPDVVDSDTILVLAGGLMQSKTFQQGLRVKLTAGGFAFKDVQHIGQPASVCAHYLYQQVWGK